MLRSQACQVSDELLLFWRNQPPDWVISEKITLEVQGMPAYQRLSYEFIVVLIIAGLGRFGARRCAAAAPRTSWSRLCATGGPRRGMWGCKKMCSLSSTATTAWQRR